MDEGLNRTIFGHVMDFPPTTALLVFTNHGNNGSRHWTASCPPWAI